LCMHGMRRERAECWLRGSRPRVYLARGVPAAPPGLTTWGASPAGRRCPASPTRSLALIRSWVTASSLPVVAWGAGGGGRGAQCECSRAGCRAAWRIAGQRRMKPRKPPSICPHPPPPTPPTHRRLRQPRIVMEEGAQVGGVARVGKLLQPLHRLHRIQGTAAVQIGVLGSKGEKGVARTPTAHCWVAGEPRVPLQGLATTQQASIHGGAPRSERACLSCHAAPSTSMPPTCSRLPILVAACVTRFMRPSRSAKAARASPHCASSPATCALYAASPAAASRRTRSARRSTWCCSRPSSLSHLQRA
jgi:hypothetical protein